MRFFMKKKYITQNYFYLYNRFFVPNRNFITLHVKINLNLGFFFKIYQIPGFLATPIIYINIF